MPLYRPRMGAMLRVPLWGSRADRAKQLESDSVATFPVELHHATLSRNDHHHADELTVKASWRGTGVDTRLLPNAIVEFYLGQADDYNRWQMKERDLQFVGIVTEVGRANDGSSAQVEIKALDFTTLFLESKPYPPDGIPTYDMTLDDAWRMIVRHTGGKDIYGDWFRSAELLSDKLVPYGFDDWPPSLGRAVSKRAASGRIPVQQNSDAWGVWQACCGLLGVVSWIDRYSVVVSTSANIDTGEKPPVMIWGKSINSIHERRNCAIAGKKVCVMGYDPINSMDLQSTYPPQGEQAVKTTKPVKRGAQGAQKDDYEVFEYNGVFDQATLDSIAKRVYDERSCQELEGTLVTSDMSVETASEESFDLLRLGVGQGVRVEIDQATLSGMANSESVGQRIAWLKERGYSDTVAEILAKNMDALSRLTSVFYTKAVTTTLECGSNSGSFTIEITYCNRLEPNGDAMSSKNRK